MMTREEAIKTLRELWRETNDHWYEETYSMAIEALEQMPSADVQPVQRWIPCSERLPENSRTVLVTDWGETDFGRRYDGRWWNCDDVLKDVSAWMPLPEPYKDGE